MGYTVFEWKDGRQQFWLTSPLGKGWLVAYRVTYHGDGAQRRARIGEVRIVPGSLDPHRSEEFLPQRDYERWEARLRAAGRWSFPAFSFDAVRRGLTARLFADALAAASLYGRDDAWAEATWPPSQVEKPASKPRIGRPPVHTPLFYATFALRYHNVEHGPRREPGQSTRGILARRYKVPVSTIGKWIRTVRQLGFLTPAVRQGSRGGMVTERAKTIIRGKS